MAETVLRVVVKRVLSLKDIRRAAGPSGEVQNMLGPDVAPCQTPPWCVSASDGVRFILGRGLPCAAHQLAYCEVREALNSSRARARTRGGIKPCVPSVAM